jgi:GNAT superfamily N-acetyltransferase
VGRIVAIHNRNHVAVHDEPVGFFGFFECENDQEAADALFRRTAEWMGERGLETLRGPASFSVNEVFGLLVEGFDRPPVIMMPYNPAYYVDLIRGAGFAPVKTLLAFYLGSSATPEFLVRQEERLSRRYRVRLRSIRMKEFDAELETVRAIYNTAWEKNWGFVPMTEEEIRFMARELKPAVARDPELVTIVESEEGEPVGFSLVLKDYNQALIHAKGRLFPFGLVKILWHARNIDFARVLTLGLVPEYRGKGIDALIYTRIFRVGASKGINQGELSWVLDDNLPMLKPLEKVGARVYKRYRLYDRPL